MHLLLAAFLLFFQGQSPINHVYSNATCKIEAARGWLMYYPNGTFSYFFHPIDAGTQARLDAVPVCKK